ncbi:MAG TPA: HepT-like ribonuclease domain-containing protein [Steroidobacteraceae bacterium]|nr:HepT-like ribonuclease domain-containing protein [Steroidobacteraceae bacterium]
MERDPRLYVDHMLEAIANIESDTAGLDFERFRKDRRVRQLVERNLEIISEASRRLPQSAKDAEGAIPWRAIAGIGNVIRHDYHDTYPSVLWETCVKDLQPLKSALRRVHSILAAQNDGK